MKRKGLSGDILASSTGLALTLLFSFALVVLIIFLLSKAPLQTIYYFFVGAFTNKYYLGNMLNSAVPLLFTGLGISIAFKSSVFNLGGEGQVYAGGLAATAVCLAFPQGSGYAVGGSWVYRRLSEIQRPAETCIIGESWTVRTANGWVYIGDPVCGWGTHFEGQSLTMMDGHAKFISGNPLKAVFQDSNGVWNATYFTWDR